MIRHALQLLACAGTGLVHAASPAPVFSTLQLTPETAWVAAKAAMDHCRQAGHQVSVAVVDRSGLLQVQIRDRFAGPHTVELAPRKAWTAASFRMPTATLANETQSGRPMSGLRAANQVMAIGGGQVIEAAGAVIGAIGVSGAPGGDADDACALAGVRAVADAIELRD